MVTVQQLKTFCIHMECSLVLCLPANLLFPSFTVSILRFPWSYGHIKKRSLCFVIPCYDVFGCIKVGIIGTTPNLNFSFKIWLYISILLKIRNLKFLPMNQECCLYFRSNSFLLFLTCSFQLSLASRVMPKYLAFIEYGVILSLMSKWGGSISLLFVKFIWINLS